MLNIFSPPAILTLHLKRFQQCGYSFSKVQRHVDFSLTLDLSPFCSRLSQVSVPSVHTSSPLSLYRLFSQPIPPLLLAYTVITH